jgi:hypothetical protein
MAYRRVKKKDKGREEKKRMGVGDQFVQQTHTTARNSNTNDNNQQQQ